MTIQVCVFLQAVLGREVVQLEDLVKWAEKAHGSSHKDVTVACEVKDQANSVVKVRTWVGVDSCRGTLEASACLHCS